MGMGVRLELTGSVGDPWVLVGGSSLHTGCSLWLDSNSTPVIA